MNRILVFLMIGLTLSLCSCTRTTDIVQTQWGFVRGTGFAVGRTDDSYIIATVAHLIEDANEPPKVVFVDGIVSRILAVDTERDVMLVQMPRGSRRLTVFDLADARQAEEASAMGFVEPLGRPFSVIYVGHVITEDWNGFVAFDGGMYPGCSGGPLRNSRGQVIGMASRLAVKFSFPDDVTNLFVPSSSIREILNGVDY